MAAKAPARWDAMDPLGLARRARPDAGPLHDAVRREPQLSASEDGEEGQISARIHSAFRIRLQSLSF